MRFAICTTLVVFGIIIGGGMLALLPRAFEMLAARAERSKPSTPKIQHTRTTLPEPTRESEITVRTTSAAETAPEQLSPEIQHNSSVLPEPARQSEIKEPLHDTIKRLA